MTGSSTAVATATNPFVGPRPIDTGQKIFGRDREIEQLYYLLSGERIVLLHSPSGAGKSSLIQAGLLPRLTQLFDVWGPTRVNLQPPEGDLVGGNRYVRSANLGFEARIPKERQRRPELISAMTLSEYVAGRPRRRSAPPNIVLLFDQFEEILTVDPLALEAKHEFFEQVGKLLQDHPHVWALFALREDYLAPLDPYAEQVPTHLKNRFRLDLLGREAAREAISRSVEEGGRSFVSEAVGKLVNDLATMQVQRPDGTFESQTGPYVEPLHLQVACRGLWERLPEDRLTIDLDDIRSFGDVTKALAQYYEKEMAEIAGGDARVERALREWVGGKLITPDGIRGQVLKGAGESEGLDNELIGRLVDTHLVRGEQRAGAVWYELSHDRLIEPVRSNNKKWFDAHLSKVQKVTTVWEAQGRPDGLLLLGADLAEAKQWAAVNGFSLTAIERKFLEASEAKQEAIRLEQRQSRRLRLALGIAIALAVAALFATWKAHESEQIAKREAAKAERQRIAADAAKRVADGKTIEAEKQKGIADAKTTEALAQKTEAEKQKGIAENKTLEAERQARIATSRELATTALLNKDRQLDLASLLSVEATNLADTFDARNALLSTFQSNPDLWTYLPHPSAVARVAFSPDGKRLVSASSDAAITLWDVASRKPIGAFLPKHTKPATSVVFSPDGKTLASASSDGTIRFWDVASLQLRGDPLQFGPKVPETGWFDGVLSLSFSSDGTILASGNGNATVELWDVATREHLGEIPFPQIQGAVRSVAFRPGERVLAVGRVHGTELWDVDGRQSLGELAGGSNMASLAFSPATGKVLAGVNDGENKVVLWDVEKQRALMAPLDPFNGRTGVYASTVAFSPDGRLLAIGSTDKMVRIWDMESRKYLGEPLKGHPNSVRSVAFSPDGTLLASASDSRAVRLWKISKQLSVGDIHPAYPPEDPTTAMTGLAFSPGGKVLATASSNKRVRLWDVASRQFLGELPVYGPEASKPVSRFSMFDGLTSVAFSPDGKILASASGALDGQVRLFDIATQRPVENSLQQHGTPIVTEVAFSPDGKLLASADASGSISLWLWDVASRMLVREHPKADSPSAVLRVVFSPDGKNLALSYADGKVQLWEVPSRPSIGIPTPTQSSAIQGLSVRDIFTQNESSGACGIAFSPDSKVLASAHHDGTIRLLTVASRLPFGETLQGHSSPVCGVAFSPDGKILASASKDEAVRLWDVTSRQPLGEFLKGPTEGEAKRFRFRPDVAFSPDGKILASASADHTLNLWDVDQKSWASRACERANRNMSQAEWEHYIGKNVPYHRTCPNLPDGEGVPRK